MKVLVTGSSGFIGTALVDHLSAEGHSVTRLVRSAPRPGQAHWDPAAGRLHPSVVEGQTAVVHLAGAGIGDRRWSEARKSELRESRVKSTTLLATTLAAMARPPAVLASGSAVGFYGDRGDALLTEDDGPGQGFLAQLVKDWEAATAPAEAAGIRVVHLRSGIVLSDRGGALRRQLLPFRLGVGGRIGSGRQYTSWISLDDEVGAIEHVLLTDTLRGPVNLTAPTPVTNAGLTAALGRVVRRPTVLPVPLLALRAVLGPELVSEMLLGGQRVLPSRLLQSGYRFRYPTIEEALRHLLHKAE